METWMIYGLLTALFLGISSILLKLAGGPDNYNMSPGAVAIFVLVGAAIILVPYFLIENRFVLSVPYGQTAIGIAILSGALWALASIFLYNGFSLGADASKLIPMMNVSALVAVAIGILFLHEMPSNGETWRTAVGACMVVLGASMLG